MGCSLEQNFVTLNDGNSIPAVGLGVFQIPPTDTEQAVAAALRAGHRHIDTAAVYRNERETGRTVADSDVPRDQLYVVTKLWNTDQGPGPGYHSTLAAFPHASSRHGPARARLSPGHTVAEGCGRTPAQVLIRCIFSSVS
jgi:2,5-diketo-D-gluconate reductase A